MVSFDAVTDFLGPWIRQASVLQARAAVADDGTRPASSWTFRQLLPDAERNSMVGAYVWLPFCCMSVSITSLRLCTRHGEMNSRLAGDDVDGDLCQASCALRSFLVVMFLPLLGSAMAILPPCIFQVSFCGALVDLVRSTEADVEAEYKWSL